MTAGKSARARSFPDPVVDVYKKDVDRSLLRENLKLSPEERLLKLQNFVRVLGRLAAARMWPSGSQEPDRTASSIAGRPASSPDQ